MKYAKNHFITRLRDDHLDDILLMSLTDILTDVEKISHNKHKQVGWFVGRILWHINLCWLFNAKSIHMKKDYFKQFSLA